MSAIEILPVYNCNAIGNARADLTTPICGRSLSFAMRPANDKHAGPSPHASGNPVRDHVERGRRHCFLDLNVLGRQAGLCRLKEVVSAAVRAPRRRDCLSATLPDALHFLARGHLQVERAVDREHRTFQLVQRRRGIVSQEEPEPVRAASHLRIDRRLRQLRRAGAEDRPRRCSCLVGASALITAA